MFFDYYTNPWEVAREAARRNRRRRRGLREMGEQSPFPAMNVWTNNEDVIVTTELSGFNADDIEISVVERNLQVSGKRNLEELKEGEVFHRQERMTGQFSRSIRLPFLVDNNKVEAEYANGVLKIYLPRAESEKPQKIQIKSN